MATGPFSKEDWELRYRVYRDIKKEQLQTTLEHINLQLEHIQEEKRIVEMVIEEKEFKEKIPEILKNESSKLRRI